MAQRGDYRCLPVSHHETDTSFRRATRSRSAATAMEPIPLEHEREQFDSENCDIDGAIQQPLDRVQGGEAEKENSPEGMPNAGADNHLLMLQCENDSKSCQSDQPKKRRRSKNSNQSGAKFAKWATGDWWKPSTGPDADPFLTYLRRHLPPVIPPKLLTHLHAHLRPIFALPDPPMQLSPAIFALHRAEHELPSVWTVNEDGSEEEVDPALGLDVELILAALMSPETPESSSAGEKRVLERKRLEAFFDCCSNCRLVFVGLFFLFRSATTANGHFKVHNSVRIRLLEIFADFFDYFRLDMRLNWSSMETVTDKVAKHTYNILRLYCIERNVLLKESEA